MREGSLPFYITTTGEKLKRKRRKMRKKRKVTILHLFIQLLLLEEESSASEREERPVELRSGISSVLSGLETPEVDIRKVPLPDPERNIQNIHEMSKNVGLYKVLDQYKVIL
jgi:hypothetical protein